jgi:hypothetical protein
MPIAKAISKNNRSSAGALTPFKNFQLTKQYPTKIQVYKIKNYQNHRLFNVKMRIFSNPNYCPTAESSAKTYPRQFYTLI